MFEYKATCVRVVDGDTYELDVDLGFGVHVRQKFRLMGIDTPETHGRKRGSPEHVHGMQASERARQLLFRQEPTGGIVENTGEHLYEDEPVDLVVRTHKDATGKYGRFLAVVELPDGRLVADILRDEGLAKRSSYDDA